MGKSEFSLKAVQVALNALYEGILGEEALQPLNDGPLEAKAERGCLLHGAL